MDDQINQALKQALEALNSCEYGGWVDVDRDWHTTQHFDSDKVEKAKATIEKLLRRDTQYA